MADGSEGDTTDAKRNILSKPVVSGLSQGTEDSDEYPMKSEIKGLCIIFNHEEFNSDDVKEKEQKKRTGTNVDEKSLKDIFTELGFDVKIHKNLTVKEIMDVLNKVQNADHSQFSCFVCCVLTHGKKDVLFAKDGTYSTEEIFAPFPDDVCPELAGKPKMFFIQACQGYRLDSGVKVICKESSECGDISQSSESLESDAVKEPLECNAVVKESLECDPYFRIFTDPDFLIVYSTIPGFYSWRNPGYGSYFIQALCEALEDHARDKNILQILTIVNREVAFDFESNRPEPSLNSKKQMPLIQSTLIKDLKFYP